MLVVQLSLSEIFAVRVVRCFLACDMFDRLSIFAVEIRRGKGPFVNYVIMFLTIFDQVTTLVIIGYHSNKRSRDNVII